VGLWRISRKNAYIWVWKVVKGYFTYRKLWVCDEYHIKMHTSESWTSPGFQKLPKAPRCSKMPFWGVLELKMTLQSCLNIRVLLFFFVWWWTTVNSDVLSSRIKHDNTWYFYRIVTYFDSNCYFERARATLILIYIYIYIQIPDIYWFGLSSIVINGVWASPIKHDNTRYFLSDVRQIGTNHTCIIVFSVRLWNTVNIHTLTLSRISR